MLHKGRKARGSGREEVIEETGNEIIVGGSTELTGRALQRADYKEMKDEGLMSAIASGERLALEELYDRYVSGCFGLALKIVHDQTLAEEVVQDVFMKVWVQPKSYQPERGKFSGWLLTLVHNRSVDKLRRAKAAGQNINVPLEMDNGSGLIVADTLPDQAPTPEEAAWRTERGNIVREALSRLPSYQREAISLAYLGGLTQKEIAERLGEPLGTIKTRTRSGLMALRRLLSSPTLLGEAE